MNNNKASKQQSLAEPATKAAPQDDQAVSTHLQLAIDACTTMEQLKSLLFSTRDKGELILAAFDRRIEELEQSAKRILQTLK